MPQNLGLKVIGQVVTLAFLCTKLDYKPQSTNQIVLHFSLQQDSMTIHYQSEDSTASTVVPQNGDATLPDTPHNSTVSLPPSQESAALPTDTASYNGISLPQVPADGTPISVIPPGSLDEDQDGENESKLGIPR